MADYKEQSKHQKLYGTNRWRKRSGQQRHEHPLCKMCADKGLVTAAEVADHVVPHHGIVALFWFGELQSLCKRCHDKTKQLIEKGSYKGYSEEIGTDGFPVDPNHPFNRKK